MRLRPYQEEAVASIIHSLMAGKQPVCCLPTGSGKSLVIAELCNRLHGRVLVVTHRKELIEQNEATLMRLGGGSVGTYSAGLGRRELEARVIFAGVASIYKRMAELQRRGPFHYVIWDEAHHGLSGRHGETMGDQVLLSCTAAQRIGMSATPYRIPDIPIWGDGDEWFDTLATHKTILELTGAGYLCRLVGVQTAAIPDLSHVRSRAGDFALSDLSQASSEELVVDAACDEILHLAPDRRHVMIFCVDRAHAEIVREALSERGCAPGVVLGNTPAEERAEILSRFKSGELRYLINVGVLTTGFDAPSVDCVAILRATQSRSLFVQMAGRACRLHPEKANALVLDAGGNLRRHMPIDGLPNILRSPALAEAQEVEEQRERQRKEKEREARHDAMVAKGIDPLAVDNPDLDYVNLLVIDCAYLLRPAKKYPTRQNLIVSYKCVTPEGSRRTVTQFVLLEYPGRPGAEAVAWFARRGLGKPPRPRQALNLAWQAPTPTEIIVGKNGQWDVILMEHFEEEGDDET